MKKFLFIALALVFAIGANAQPRWGVKGGANISKYIWKVGDSKVDDLDARIGGLAGIMMEYSFVPSFSIQPELMYRYNSTRIKNNESLTPGKDANLHFHQLQLPVNLKYKLGTDDLKFFVAAGAYASYIMAGKAKGVYGEESGSIDLYGDGAFAKALDLKHFDWGAGFGIGFEVKRAIITVDYQLGLMNLSGVNNVKFRNNSLALTLGYFF